MAGAETDVRIIPFRGEYYEIAASSRGLVRGLIYPVPDPDLPFLGVHFTRRVDGKVEAGPNAVLALRREGYRKTDINISELVEAMTFGGFWKMARKFWKVGAGVRAQAVDRSGKLADDFRFAVSDRAVHV